MTQQLDFDGRPADPVLGLRQSMTLADLRAGGPRDEWEVGRMLHGARGRHRADERCDYCVTDGAAMLRGLEARGLVRKTADGWIATWTEWTHTRGGLT